MINIRDYGAAEGIDSAEAFRKALSAGEAIIIPHGTYDVSALRIPSGADIRFEEGAVLRFIDNPELYPPVLSRWEGVECYCMHPLIFIDEAEDVSITGPGIIDGNGRRWWDYIYYRRAEQKEPLTDIEKKFAALNPDYLQQPGGGGGRQTQFLRPPLLQIRKSRNVKLEGITLTNSPFWTLHPLFSEDLEVKNVKIINPYVTPNTDGIDIESCRRVRITSCYVDVGDDGIALKSGSGDDGIKAGIPAEDIIIEDSTVKQAHGGFVIGSETAAGVRNVTVSGCHFIGTDRGIRIKTRRGRGGVIRNIKVSDIEMSNVISPITINMYYRWGSDDPMLYSLEKQEVTYSTPSVSDILIERVKAEHCRASAGFFAGLPEMPISNVVIRDSSFSVDDKEKGLEVEMFRGIEPSDARGIRIINADVKLENVTVNAEPDVVYV